MTDIAQIQTAPSRAVALKEHFATGIWPILGLSIAGCLRLLGVAF